MKRFQIWDGICGAAIALILGHFGWGDVVVVYIAVAAFGSLLNLLGGR